MSTIFLDGFDKYGPALPNAGAFAQALLVEGEWTTAVPGGPLTITTPLSASGQGLQLGGSSGAISTLSKTLGANYTTAIGGFRFNAPVGAAAALITFTDVATSQSKIQLNVSGTFSLINGAGTVLGTSTTAVTNNSTHYLEWDVVFGASAAYTVYLDGVAIITGTGNTIHTANSYYNGIILASNSSSNSTFDDLYLFSTAGSVDNAPLLTNPMIYTELAASDSSVAFTVGAGILGYGYAQISTTSAPGANELFLLEFTPAVNCTIASVSCVPGATSGTANMQAVIYSNSAGAPHTLLSAGTTVTGTTSGTALTGVLTTPQALTAGTPYWIGFITDTSVVLAEYTTATTAGVKAANTFTSGAPGTAPAVTAGQPTWQLWGNLTAVANNYPEVALTPPLGSLSYVTSSTVAAEDLYGFGNLPANTTNVYSVGVKGYMAVPGGGTRTVSMVTKSGATTGSGSMSPASMATSFLWYDSYFDTDPNTSVAWTVANANASTSGMYIAT